MLRSFMYMVAGLSFSAGPAAALPARPPLHKVASLKITVLSTMLADRGMGEWGFSVLVEADGHRILFDTGLHPETVLDNAHDLGIDLSNVTDVVLSHHHGDHTGGLVELRQELSKKSPSAMSRIHVAPGIFLSRRQPGRDDEANPTIAVKTAMTVWTLPGESVEHRRAAQALAIGFLERTLEAMFIFIGTAPRTAFCGDLVQRDAQGFVLTGRDLMNDGQRPAGWTAARDPYLFETNVPGIFCAGDARHGSGKRVAAAVGEGSATVSMSESGECQQPGDVLSVPGPE